MFEQFSAVGVSILIASHDGVLLSQFGHRTLTLDHGSCVTCLAQPTPRQAGQSPAGKPAGRAARASDSSNCLRIRNGPLTAGLMSLVIGVAMTLPALLVLISANLQTQLGKVEDMAEITAYFSNDIANNRVSEISERLHSLFANVEIRYVSAASALAQLSEVMTLKPILNALEYNPLPAALLVRPDEPGVATAREIEQILTNLPEVELVQLDSLWLQRLEAWLDSWTPSHLPYP